MTNDLNLAKTSLMFSQRRITQLSRIKMTKICVIGAGPSGMSVLVHHAKLKALGTENLPEVVCYEKQSDWGGLWNYTWRTGNDEYGEPIHGSMYRHLWCNVPKEAGEYCDYTFDEHYQGKNLPSYVPRSVIMDYLQGRWNKYNLKTSVKFNTIVRNVKFNNPNDGQKSNNFTVKIENLIDKSCTEEVFDYVFIASGHFSAPFVPEISGIQSFPGRVLHAHDLRTFEEFRSKRILIIGSSRSAEDVSLQFYKFGTSAQIMSYRTKEPLFDLPPNTILKPLVTSLNGSTAQFKDGTKADVDVIIFCTGYIGHYPFMDDSIRFRPVKNIFFHKELYKGVVYTQGGDDKILYLGAFNNGYAFSMFDVQAFWALKYVLGIVEIPSRNEMLIELEALAKKALNVQGVKGVVRFLGEYSVNLGKDCDFGPGLDRTAMLFERIHGEDPEDKRKSSSVHNSTKSGSGFDILSYRNIQHTSVISKVKAAKQKIPFIENFNDDLKSFLSDF